MVDERVKQTAGKPRTRLLYEQFQRELYQILAVLEYGAKKYPHPPNDDSWKQVPEEYYREAAQRHLNQVYQGEIFDTETGLPHMAHLMADSLFILWFHNKEDDSLGNALFDEEWRTS